MIPNINLLPKTDKRSSESNFIYILVGALAAIGIGFMAWQYFSVASQLDDLQAQQSTLQSQVTDLQAQYNSLLTVVPQGSIEESVTFVERVSYPVSPLIDETNNLLPANTYLTSYSFSEASVSIAVDFETLTDVAEYVSRLENSSFFTDAQLSTVSTKEITVGEQETTGVESVDRLKKFDELPRYSTNITLAIDQAYLASGGGR